MTNNIEFSNMNLGYYLTQLGYKVLLDFGNAQVVEHETTGNKLSIFVENQGQDNEIISLLINDKERGYSSHELGRTAQDFQDVIHLLQDTAWVERTSHWKI